MMIMMMKMKIFILTIFNFLFFLIPFFFLLLTPTNHPTRLMVSARSNGAPSMSCQSLSPWHLTWNGFAQPQPANLNPNPWMIDLSVVAAAAATPNSDVLNKNLKKY